MPGPPPKRASQRRRANKPVSYGAADPEVAGKASAAPDDIGFEAHPLIEKLWSVLRDSVEATYYSAADWERARAELWYGNRLITGPKNPSGEAWSTFQSGLNTLLISPADKRRAGIELARVEVDEDEQAAVVALADYQRQLGVAK